MRWNPGALERFLDRDRRRPARGVHRPSPGSGRRCRPSCPPVGAPIYLCVADRDGGAVSLIESNYAGFGSGLVDPETGIGYQNRGAFFRLEPGHANSLAPRKRTLHTLTPGMLLRDGRPWIVHGSMGGEIQPQVFAQVVSAIVDGGVDVATAVGAPRWAADVPRHLEPASADRARVPLPTRGRRRAARARPRAPGHRALVVRDGPRPRHRDRPRWMAAAPVSFAAAADPRSEGLPGAW